MKTKVAAFVVSACLLSGFSPLRAEPSSLGKAGRNFTDLLNSWSLEDVSASAPAVRAVPLLYYKIKPEDPNPDPVVPGKHLPLDAMIGYWLDSDNSDWYWVPGGGKPLGALLIVDKSYGLTDADLARVSKDISEAMREIPQFVQRPPRVTSRITIYIYDDGPVSTADVPGAQHGERGILMRFVKEDQAPIFHEMTHLLAGYSDSQSLAEGVADYVDNHFRPGKAHAFVPANLNPHLAARRAVSKYSRAFFNQVGAPGYYYPGSNSDERFDFYFASWSFVDYLAGIGSMKQLWSVIDSGGTPDSYQKTYGRSFAQIKRGWLERIALEPVHDSRKLNPASN